ncbi:MAG TPA: FapA family protein [Candidatus Wallbacteria bacterium]|nr:FapA family protein [Candidatus Wallbacteria bacterium]
MSIERKIFEGETKQKAIDKGLKVLGVKISDVEVVVLEEGSSSFLGLFNKPFKVELKLLAAEGAESGGSGDEAKEVSAPEAEPEKPKEPAVDGDYRLSLIEDALYIVVTPPQGAGRPVKPDKIFDDLKKAGLKQYESEPIRQAASPTYYGTPIKICSPTSIPATFKLQRDCNIRIIIDKSKMTASAICDPPFNGGEEISVAKLQMALSANNVKVPPDYEAINKMVNSKMYNEPVVVASGKPPIAGEDGYIKWYFETESKKIEIEIDDQGNVDYHKILKINTVNANEMIGEKIDPVSGVDGFNVFNEPIKAKAPKTAKMVKGKNVEITADGYFFQSLISGQLIIKNEVPSVMPLFEVKGDVDYSTGNIEFNGSVIVHGTVLDGFSVKSEGNIEIKKTVNAAILEAKGNVILAGGFIGKESGSIKAGGKIGAKFIQGGVIYSDDEVIVENNIMHSNVTSGRQVVVKGKKAAIVGGRIFASEYVEAQTIGAPAGTKTQIDVGVDILKEQEIVRIDSEISQTADYIQKIMISIDTLNNLKFKNPQKFSAAQEQILQKSIATKETLAAKQAELSEQKTLLCNEIVSSQKGKVVALNSFFPGVFITIRKHFKYDIKDNIKCSAIGISDGDIRILPI